MMKKLSWGLLLFLGIFYLLFIPSAVQHGDTGELVTNSYLLRVSHPPGYPLFTWIMSLGTRIWGWTSVYGAASITQVLLALGALAFVLRLALKQSSFWLALPIVALLGTSRLFWEYAILPDVFMLNNFFIAAVSFFYFQESSRRNLTWLILVFCLGLTNHQTLILLAPLVLYKVYAQKEFKWGSLMILAGFVGFCLINASMLALDSKSPGTWGQIDGFKPLLDHVLRRTYGTFNLATGEGKNTYGAILSLFFDNLSLDLWALLLLFAAGMQQLGKRMRICIPTLVYLGCFLLYVTAFFALMRIRPEGPWLAIAERFLLMPMMLLVFLGIRSGSTLEGKVSQVLGGLMLVNILINVINYRHENNYRTNFAVEDHARNLLTSLPKDAVFLISGDTDEYALQYLQQVLKERTDVLVVSPIMLAHPWYIKKLKEKQPRFRYPERDPSRMFGERFFHVIEENFGSLPLYVSPMFFNLKVLSHHDLHWSGPAAEIRSKTLPTPGKLTYDCGGAYRTRSAPEAFEPGSGFSAARYYQSFQGLCDLSQGDEFLKNGNPSEALNRYEIAAQKVGFPSQGTQKACELRHELKLPLGENCEFYTRELGINP